MAFPNKAKATKVKVKLFTGVVKVLSEQLGSAMRVDMYTALRDQPDGS